MTKVWDRAAQETAGKAMPETASAPARVVIIGCGFTGASALFQLVDRHPVRRITVFEAAGDFGPG